MSQWDQGPSGPPQMRLSLPPLTPMVKRLMIVNAAVFIGVVMLGFMPGVQRRFVDLFGISPAVWRDWFPLAPLWQPLTYGFLHSAQTLNHLLFNMLTLYMIGGMLEAQIGGRRLLFHYLVAVVVGGLAYLAVALMTSGQVSAIGASGACMAVLVAAATLRPNATVLLIVFPVPLKFIAGLLVIYDLFAVVMQLQGAAASGVAHSIHLAGAAYGFVAVRRRWIWADPLSAFERKRAAAEVQQQQSDEQRMDELLAKINREGMGSLSGREREFLKRQAGRGR